MSNCLPPPSCSLLSPSGATNEIAPSSPLDMDTIQLAVDTSSDEDVHSSSDSDDERYVIGSALRTDWTEITYFFVSSSDLASMRQ